MQCGWDIGGTLTKLAIFLPSADSSSASSSSSSFAAAQAVVRQWGMLDDRCVFSQHRALQVPGGQVYFASLPTSVFLDHHHSPSSSSSTTTTTGGRQNLVFATGGGAHKFEPQLLRITNTSRVVHLGEIEALYNGLDELLTLGGGGNSEVFVCKNVRFAGMLGEERGMIETEPIRLETNGRSDQEGFLLVNIGSGVSFVDCNGRGEHKRVGGSSLGGATFLGLVTLLCHVTSFEEALELASLGDSTVVDLLVGDIYASESGDTASASKRVEELGLRVSTLAASFGKMANSKLAREAVRREDLALSVLIMISLNLAAMAYLHSTIHGQRRTVLFVGSFLSNGGGVGKRNTLACRTLTYGIEFWGKMRGRDMRAAFLQREGYLGALGVLAKARSSSSSTAAL